MQKETQGKMLCDNEEKNCSNAFISQGLPRIDDNHQNLGKKHGTDCPAEPLEGTNPGNTLISDFWPSEL